MVGRRAALVAIGLWGAAGAASAQSPALALHPDTLLHYSAVGLASWYGGEFHGHTTADGEKFDMRSISAAHKTLPLPCYARVTNLRNNRSIIVRVNDRGPYFGGRIVDVSARVARLLEFDRLGTTKVRLDYVGKAPAAGSDDGTLLASLQANGAPVVAESASPPRPALLVAERAPEPPPRPKAEDGVTVAVQVAERTRGIALTPRPTPVFAGGAPSLRLSSDDSAAVVVQVADHPGASETPSPYGALIVSPFLAQLAGR